MTNKLCPFCGGEPLEKLDSTDRYPQMERQTVPNEAELEMERWAYNVRCNSCGAKGGWAKNPGGAWRWWNMRPEGKTE